MKGIIYKYTFPDGKVYIGQTSNPEKRIHEHIGPKIGPVNKGFWEAYQRFGTYEYEVIRDIAARYIREHERQIIDDVQSARTIVQIDKEGNVVREFTSFLEICQAFNVPRADNVRNVLKGKQKSAYGYCWKYKKDM